jgi:hypothetical protein
MALVQSQQFTGNGLGIALRPLLFWLEAAGQASRGAEKDVDVERGHKVPPQGLKPTLFRWLYRHD